jgi:hypothetical protein
MPQEIHRASLNTVEGAAVLRNPHRRASVERSRSLHPALVD